MDNIFTGKILSLKYTAITSLIIIIINIFREFYGEIQFNRSYN